MMPRARFQPVESQFPVLPPGKVADAEYMAKFSLVLLENFGRLLNGGIVIASEIDFVNARRDGVGLPVGGTYIDTGFVKVVEANEYWIGGTVTTTRTGAITAS